jgi:hypothetical protein
MTSEQHDKAAAWFQRLSANVQCTRFDHLLYFIFTAANIILICIIPFLITAVVL